MQEKVVIILQNTNALISMALVSQNADNPYHAFCEYIKYCVTVSGNRNVLISDIKGSVEKEFGIKLPINIVRTCLEYLSEEDFLCQNKEAIEILKSYDTGAFDAKRREYKETEDKLICALVDYANNYNKSWDKKDAKEQLIRVLDNSGLAFDIFSKKDISSRQDEIDSIIDEINSLGIDDEECIEDTDKQVCEDDTPIFSDENIIGRFIKKTLAEDSVLTDYLIRVCEGLMICAGTYQLPSKGKKSNYPDIKGTKFFFDTRLLLRVLGCANEAAVDASRELVNLIQQNGGSIYYYPQTLSEMQNAFDNAIDQYQAKEYISDNEMRFYAISSKHPLEVLRSKKASLVEELSKLYIYSSPLGYYDDKETLRYGFDREDLVSFIRSETKWRNKVIENDATSIWETHMLRKADYTAYCGTHLKLPVFVTTNTRLPLLSLLFSRNRPNTNSLSQWKNNRLPVITDVRLTCRLWNPSKQSERLSLLLLTANSVAAQRPTPAYVERMRSTVEELSRKSPEYSNISLSEFFDDNITDSIFELTQGKDDNFKLSTLATTIEEKVILRDEQHAKEIDSLNSQHNKEKSAYDSRIEKISSERDEYKNRIIESAVKRNKRKITKPKLLVRILLYSGEIISVVALIVSIIVSVSLNNWIPTISAVPLIVVLIVLALIEKYAKKEFILNRVLNRFYPGVKEKYIARICEDLNQTEMKFQDEITKEILEQDKAIVEVKKLLSIN